MIKRFRVMLVEDDEDDYVITRDMLAEATMSVDLSWVTDYNDALEAIQRGEHDVYLVDFQLGAYTGIDLLREAIESGCKAPIILLTGQGDHDVDVEAMRIGAADYLVKGQTGVPLLERSIRYAVERAQMLETLRELAIRDELTGLYNRREMSRLLTEEIDRCRRYNNPVSFVLLDIDHFKSVNDAFGHQVGDTVLQWVAGQVRESIRTTDRPVRYGGEEIAIILPETTCEEAYNVADRLRLIIEGKSILVADANRNPVEIKITVSLGVAGMPGNIYSEDDLISATDQALYEAKREGRNRTVLFRETNHVREPVM